MFRMCKLLRRDCVVVREEMLVEGAESKSVHSSDTDEIEYLCDTTRGKFYTSIPQSVN